MTVSLDPWMVVLSLTNWSREKTGAVEGHQWSLDEQLRRTVTERVYSDKKGR